MDDKLLLFLRRAIRFGITLIIVGVLLNDGVRVVTALSAGFGALKDAANAALDAASVSPTDRDGAQAAAAAAAAARGIQLVAYDQQVVEGATSMQITVRLAVDARVKRSIVIAPVVGLVRGTPPAEWCSDAGAPITLRQRKQVSYFSGTQ